MSNISTISSLPDEARNSLEAWLRDTAIPQAEATRRLNALLEDLGLGEQQVSRYTVSRYNRRMQLAGERVLQSRQIADAWIAEFGSSPEGPAGRLVIEILRTVAFDLASRLQDFEVDEKSLSRFIENANRISAMVERLERSREIGIRCDREIKRQAAEEKAKARKAKPPPLDPERMREVVRQIYGVELKIRNPPSALPVHHESRNKEYSSS